MPKNLLIKMFFTKKKILLEMRGVTTPAECFIASKRENYNI